MDKKPYTIISETNADVTRYSLILLVKEEPVLQRWALFASDIVHSLRCSLDYIVYAIAAYESGQEIPPDFRRLQFPICNDGKQFRENKWRIAALSQSVRAAIESTQPYNRPHEIYFPLLGILRDIDNFNKHRLLKVIIPTIARGDIGFTGPHPITADNFERPPITAELKNNSEIAAFSFDSPTPDMKFDRREIIIQLAFSNDVHIPLSSIAEPVDFRALLKLLITEVKEIIAIVMKSVYSSTRP